MRRQSEEFDVRSRVAGTLVIARERDLPGRFVQKGELLAHVVDVDVLTVRAVVSQDDHRAFLVLEVTARLAVALVEPDDLVAHAGTSS